MTGFPLRGRESELRTLRELRGGALLVRGEPGMGRSALLAELRAEPGVRVLGVRGVRAERDLAFGGVQRLFGTRVCDGPTAHRLLVELSVPVLCWVDDAQWLDEPSLEVLAFAARRLAGHPVTMVLTSTLLPPAPVDDLFDTLVLGPLPEAACVALLRDRDVPAGLRPQLVELGGGNPADLVELAAALTQEQRAGRSPLSEVLPARSARYAAALAALSEEERTLAVAAAAESTVDFATLARHVPGGAAAAALCGSLSKAARSTLYAAAAPAERRRAHALLAELLDPPNRTWHRAMAADGPSDELAAELATAPAVDHAATARQLARAAALTTDHELRAARTLAAARAAWQAGRPGWARLLLARADADPGEVALLHGEIELRDGDPAVATHELAAAATMLAEPAASGARLLAGEARRLSGDLSGYAAMAPPPGSPAAAHFAGLTATYAGRHDLAAAPLREVVAAGLAGDDVASGVWAAEAAFALGHGERAHECAAAAVGRARLTRNAAALPWALVHLSLSAIVLDRHPCARAASREGLAAAQHNTRMEHLSLLGLSAALLGDRATALATLDEAAPGIAERGLGRPAAIAAWARACVDLTRDRPEDALGRLADLAAGVSGDQPAIRVLATPQLVEAAVRAEQPDRARDALEVFLRWTRDADDAWRALAHRCRAQLAASTEEAEHHFREAVALHRRAGAAMELARTQLAYAHLLRRNRRSRDARDLFRDAHRICRAVGADHWADRAQVGLRATGEAVAASAASLAGLTPQQAEISRLVAVGETNKEIARRLVISHRTVDHHLRNIFTALGVRSRVELARKVTASERSWS